MLAKLPIKKKHLVLAGTFVSLLICYQLAFKKTIAAWQLHSQFSQQLATQSNLTYQPAYMERKNKNLDTIISRLKTDTAFFRENVISKISVLAQNLHVKIIALPVEDIYYHTPQSVIQRMDMEGDFFSLLKLQYQIEHLKGIGLFRSVEIKSNRLQTTDTNEASSKLIMTVWMCGIK
ncbi:hypothetical protein HQ865_15295 [Mucilaginibacter mali]|uniref:Uncharacterized protein n=1 Tax=Mucilaginibacter mali TaxID=2740462 RepID=A0A7D4UMG7_9SPHI|nr:hypothetical protein [Mucilaginibacter mali]QKJ31061.1 hypothetical protein HQ865_15295 [Mucilaginibacter mali]